MDFRFKSTYDFVDQQSLKYCHLKYTKINWFDIPATAPVEITKQIDTSVLEQVSNDNLNRFGGSGNCPNNPDFYKCGKRNVDGLGVRIQGKSSSDSETQFGEWPHMCVVLNCAKIGDEEHSLFVCGASLIAPNVILTAAHCIE